MGCQRGAVRVRRRGGQGRDEGLELVWWHRGDGYFLQFTWHPNRPSRPLQGISARAMVCRKISDRPHTALRARLVLGWARSKPVPTLSCNSPGKAIAILRASRAYQLARWHRFVSIEHREPLRTALQGTFARAMISRKITEEHRPATHGRQSPVSARTLAFLKFTWQGNRHFTGLQGIFARAMASICIHRAPRTPPASATGHIDSRND